MLSLYSDLMDCQAATYTAWPAASDICHRDCEFTVLQTIQRLEVCTVVYGTVHYKEPLKSLNNSMAKYRLRTSYPILPKLCRKRRKPIFTHSPILAVNIVSPVIKRIKQPNHRQYNC